MNEILFLRPSCFVPSPFSEAPLSSERISFNFNLVPAAAVLELLANFDNLPYQSKVPSSHSNILGLRLKGVSSRGVHDAVALASGTALRRQGDAYAAVQVANERRCVVTAEVNFNPTIRQEGDCPSRAMAEKLGITAGCEPLERYPLHELVARGFVSVSGRPFVLLEAADHTTFLAKAGDYLGFNFGKISSIDDEGFAVREIKRDPLGIYYYERTRIDYSNNRTTLPREYP